MNAVTQSNPMTTTSSQPSQSVARICTAAFALFLISSFAVAQPARTRRQPSRPTAVPAAATPPAPAAASENGSFLPSASLGGTSSTLSRGGMEIPVSPDQLTAAPLKLTVPDVTGTTLPSGIRFYHYESHDLPNIEVIVYFRAGTLLDPAGKVGLSDLVAKTLRAGGAAGKKADEVDRALEQLGSSFELDAGREYVSGRMFTLTGNREQSMRLLAEILLHPEFDAKKLEQQRELALEEIRRENDEPQNIARREIRKLMYGADHPLGRSATTTSLASITRADVLDFYHTWYNPGTLSVGVAGDITADEARKLVESALGAWKPEKMSIAAPPSREVDQTHESGKSVTYIRKQTAQSQIRMAHFGMARHSPDEYAVEVLNNFYGGGGFTSRLMTTVRTKYGYVYGVAGGIQDDDPVGLFAAGGGSKANTTAAAIKEVLNVTRELLTGKYSQDEIETAKRDVIFGFYTRLDTPAEIVSEKIRHDVLGYPADYLKTFPDKIRAVTPEEIAAAAKKYIHPDRLKILVVGLDKAFDEPLAQFGKVTEIPLESFGDAAGEAAGN